MANKFWKISSIVIVLLLVGALIYLFKRSCMSDYTLSPLSISTSAKSTADIDTLPVKPSCSMTSSFGSTAGPGGVCGSDELVRDQADYEITAYDNDPLL